jgi:hypothetical protein
LPPTALHDASITAVAVASALAMHAAVRGSLTGGLQLPAGSCPVVHVGHERPKIPEKHRV